MTFNPVHSVVVVGELEHSMSYSDSTGLLIYQGYARIFSNNSGFYQAVYLKPNISISSKPCLSPHEAVDNLEGTIFSLEKTNTKLSKLLPKKRFTPPLSVSYLSIREIV